MERCGAGSNSRISCTLFMSKRPINLVRTGTRRRNIRLSSGTDRRGLHCVGSNLGNGCSGGSVHFVCRTAGVVVRFASLHSPGPHLEAVCGFRHPRDLLRLVGSCGCGKGGALHKEVRRFPRLPGTGFHRYRAATVARLRRSFSGGGPHTLVRVTANTNGAFATVAGACHLLGFTGVGHILFLISAGGLKRRTRQRCGGFRPCSDASGLDRLCGVRHVRASGVPSRAAVYVSAVREMCSVLHNRLTAFISSTSRRSNDTCGNSPHRVSCGPACPPRFFSIVVVSRYRHSVCGL